MVATFEKTILSSFGSRYKNYTIDGKEVKNIVFYDETGIILSVVKTIRNVNIGENSYCYDDEDISLKVCKPTRRAKENLTRQENFYIPTKKEYTWEDSTVDIYIYVDNDNVILEKEKEFITDKNYGRNRVVSTYNVFKLKGEILQTSYKRDDNGNMVFEDKEVKLLSLIKNENIETNLGKEFDKVKELLEENHISLEDYYLEKVVKYFNLQKRIVPIED